MMTDQEALLRTFKEDRKLAHKFLFEHRHKDQDPAFHEAMLDLLYSDHPLVAIMAFRGGGKSTYIEEYALLTALFRENAFTIIVGPKWESACERLAPIRNEIENNDRILELFGDQKASPWTMDELVLANGAKLQAVGAGQSMRGKKHNDERPDIAVIDDLEDEENIRTEESRDRTERWMVGTLMPALHPRNRRIRFLGTAIHPKSLIIKKCNDPEWKSGIFPIVTIDTETGAEKSAWPSRFSMEWINKERQQYLSAGRYIEFEQEYMCRAEDMAGKPFQPRMLKVEPAPQTALPIEVFVDPARTVKSRSARTGYAAWSWAGNKLIVHEAEGHFHKPDEIVNKIAEWDEKFKPIRIGVEADGLEEFIMQPLRSKCLQIGRSIPFESIHAPRDKHSFITGLQPFYAAGDVIHVKHLPDLEQELLQFPTGRIDVPNALAYALRMRAGRPVYEDFTLRHITPVLEPRVAIPRYLCVSSRPSMTAGLLVQYDDGVLKVFHDWVFNEPPLECWERMLREAIMITGQVKVIAPLEQFDQHNNTGLPAAVKRTHILPSRGTAAAFSEGALRPWLQKSLRGTSAFLVHEEARWTKNALLGGYARRLDKGGRLADYPTDNQYRLVMEALECWVAFLERHATVEDEKLTYGFKDGKRYISLRANQNG